VSHTSGTWTPTRTILRSGGTTSTTSSNVCSAKRVLALQAKKAGILFTSEPRASAGWSSFANAMRAGAPIALCLKRT
jgi:hypothetical protein